MSIWDNLIQRATGQRVIRNGFQRLPVVVEADRRVSREMMSYQDIHEIELRVISQYRLDSNSSNEAIERAKRVATQHLRRTIYGDILRLQVEIMHAIEDGDQEAARDACLRLREEIIG